ncbi:MAG: M20 family metallo-hydrolase [Blastochloris sp.]|nr:M20 family metallo-hydrolase [Blastochloris sp.]
MCQNGGRFDGAVGVVAALECLRTLRENGYALPFHLEAIDFTDDEGCWRSLLGSRALAGMVAPTDLYMQDEGMFRAALSRAGIDLRRIPYARRDPETLAGYLELHIESGPRMERTGVEIGIVTNIVGRKTFEITYHGKAGHSGTTDMYQRRDALRGAALFMSAPTMSCANATATAFSTRVIWWCSRARSTSSRTAPSSPPSVAISEPR